jgi:NAD-dependent DNA ligase
VALETLERYLQKCKETYYAGNPIISDSQYDALEDLYEKLSGEPVGIGSTRGRVKHWYKMYSLQKYYRGDKLPEWSSVVISPKLDGASLALRYIDGKFHSAVTRGNGEYGEDVSHLFIENWDHSCINLGVDWEIPFKGAIQITGEIVAPKTIKNARNYAAGALNLKDAKEFLNKDLKFFAYDMQPTSASNYAEVLGQLFYGGFFIVGRPPCEEYPTDGSVHRIASIDDYYDLGFTSKHPKGAYALKERTEGIKTKILDVIWQTGKTGVVTPVALLKPVEIDGATVSRATLNNPGFIESLGVQIGDSVMVERAGGIIPRIIRKAE